jgi:uncharacterized protein YndB with AHSA1/START domain
VNADASSTPTVVSTSIIIEATPEEVYAYFTQAELMVTWMGQYARLDPRPGGEIAVDIDGTPVRGSYQELDPFQRIVLSWGFAGSEELPPATSTVEVRLTPVVDGTRVDLVHRDLPAAQQPQHRRGWKRFLGRLAARFRPRPEQAHFGAPADARQPGAD